MDFGVKKFLPELLHFLYIVLQGFIGVGETGEYFCGMGSFCFYHIVHSRGFHNLSRLGGIDYIVAVFS